MYNTKRLFNHAALATAFAALTFTFTACSDDDKAYSVDITGTSVAEPASKTTVKGMYVLNEGQMNKNKCSLDYFDCTNGKYYNNLFAAVNPDITLGLGDTGNDLKIYKNRLYAVINVSGLVEVMDAQTAKHIGTIDIANCRSIAFNDNKAYVTSYAGEIDDVTGLQRGTVYEVDLKTLQVTRNCGVEYQPEGIVVSNNKIYVANSCVYSSNYTPYYSNRVSVIDPETMVKTNDIEVAINLNTMQLDDDGTLYVISRGNYYDVSSDVYAVNTATDVSQGALGVRAASMCLAGDSLYIIGSEFSYATYTSELSFTIYDTNAKKVVSTNFITDGTDAALVAPYGIAVNPDNGNIFIPDAGDYVNPGTMYCFSRGGKLLWKTATGDIPGHMAFTTKKVRGLE